MNEPVTIEVSEPASGGQPTAAPPSRHKSRVPGIITRPRTVASVLAAVVLALVASLIGPLGVVQPAVAEDGNPTFHVGDDDGLDYFHFINSIRARVHDGGSNSVAGASNQLVDHTNPSATTSYLQVDIHMWGNSNFVRLQIRRSDLYILGWWDKNNNYRYMGNRTVPAAESGRAESGVWRPANKTIRTPFAENYGSLESYAHERRAGMGINRSAISSAAWYLYDSDNNTNMARGVLRMTQFIAEAARFRPIRDSIQAVIGTNGAWFIPAQFAAQENNWGTLSSRFNALNMLPRGTRDQHPVTAWRRGAFNEAVAIVLYTAIQYAQYVLETSKGR
ncbi:ribosome-inactivating family protein [Streptomyces sp. NBC_01275]|uniref:ribosome-inactivating family protein n=1 Tax=Streptomyces sp. NBC_01275 TaxID=2903807 RepID=UPI00225B01B3|nr:ribosome-inactivating family protein [Streptomyces sp. NBC_01275]MCX4759676.1 ribosome-inactivating family protein [Streptomyces sp. NBC_01275]